MPMDLLPVWKAKFAQIPVDPTGFLSPTRISVFVAERVTKKLIVKPTSVEFQPSPLYTWIPAPLEAAIRSIALIPAVEPVTPNTIIANGWSTATLAAQLIINPGAKMNPPPPGTNGIVGTATAAIDPSSVTAATSQLIKDLIASPPAATPLEPVFPEAVYAAFTKIRFIITGIDTTPTPAGPIPFTINATSF